MNAGYIVYLDVTPRRFWVDGSAWSVTTENNATRFEYLKDAQKVATKMHGYVAPAPKNDAAPIPPR